MSALRGEAEISGCPYLGVLGRSILAERRMHSTESGFEFQLARQNM